MTTTERPTYRQVVLLAWLREPSNIDDLPQHEAIDWSQAAWTVGQLVEHTGLYGTRYACVQDLYALRRMGKVIKLGRAPIVQWRLGGEAP